VFSVLSSRLYGSQPDVLEMVFGFGVAFALCILATILPIRVALTRLEAVER
jgi:ABC-type lipoprotein release transport system permease subunit